MAVEGQDVDLDLYADVEGGEFSHEGAYDDLNQNDYKNDLFEDASIVASANNDFPEHIIVNNGHVGGGIGAGGGSTGSTSGVTSAASTTSNSSTSINQQLIRKSPSIDIKDSPSSQDMMIGSGMSFSTTTYNGKRVSCYVGNLTWWTTDQDLTDAIQQVGVNDLVEIKFYENKINGQSKGFAVVTVGSDQSFRTLMEKLSKKELHGQLPVVTYFNKQYLSQFEAQARKDLPATDPNRTRNAPPGSAVPGLPLARPGLLPRPGLAGPGGSATGLAQPPMGALQMQSGHRPMQSQLQPGLPLQPRPPNIQQQRMGGPQLNTGLLQRPQVSLVPNPNGQGLIRQPPGQRLPLPDPRGPQPRQEWDRSKRSQYSTNNQLHNRMPSQPGAVVSNSSSNVQSATSPLVNPAAFFPHGQAPNGMAPQMHHPPSHVHPQQMQQLGGHDNQYYRAAGERHEMYVPQISEDEFQEIMEKNKTVSSSAISRAVTDASVGDYPSAIETLVMAISLIKQSKISNDDRCKILISSLQDTLKGIEDKHYGSSKVRSNSRDSRERPRRSRSRDSRERERDRETRRRDKHRHRSRSRERRDYYEESRYHRSRH